MIDELLARETDEEVKQTALTVKEQINTSGT